MCTKPALLLLPTLLLLGAAPPEQQAGGVKTVADAVRAIEASAEPRLLNLGEVVRADDYPVKAIEALEEGATRIRINVSKSGRPIDCQIEVSSGSSTLDTQSCKLFMARARFEPVRDKSGKAVPSVVERNVSWRLGIGLPRTAWTNRVSLIVAADGTVRSCQTGLNEASPTVCRAGSFPREAARAYVQMTKSDPFELRSETAFDLGGDSSTEASPQGLTVVSRRAVRIEIGANGRIAKCDPVDPALDRPGEMSACDQARAERFQIAAGSDPAGGTTQGTIVMSTYVGPAGTPSK